ncbi:MAG: ATP-binding protein [Bacilli bacterium]|nr:ATP-binding protein [Bacilli bacterium]
MKRYEEIERSIIKKYRKEIWSKFVKAVKEYKMINENDKIAVCISGGKDSMLLAKLMQELKLHGKINFDLEFIVMDPGYNEANKKKIIDNANILNIPIHIFESDIFNVVNNVDDSPCYLCARMRRGFLYNKAQELNCNKIALGHHFDDVIETTLMSMLYGAEFKTMMPKLHSTNFKNMELIRPLYLIKEKDIITWTISNDLSFLNCACSFTEKSQFENNSKRKEIKELIKNLKTINPNVDINIFRSMCNVNLSTIIGYHKEEQTYHFLDDYDGGKNENKD